MRGCPARRPQSQRSHVRNSCAQLLTERISQRKLESRFGGQTSKTRALAATTKRSGQTPFVNGVHMKGRWAGHAESWSMAFHTTVNGDEFMRSKALVTVTSN